MPFSIFLWLCIKENITLLKTELRKKRSSEGSEQFGRSLQAKAIGDELVGVAEVGCRDSGSKIREGVLHPLDGIGR